MAKGRGSRRNNLQTLTESESMKCNRLVGTGIMFVVDLIKDALTSLYKHNNKIITTQ